MLEHAFSTGNPDSMPMGVGTRLLIEQAKRLGVNVEQQMAQMGVDIRVLQGALDSRVPVDVARLIWRELPERVGCPALSLRAAESVPSNAYPVTDHLVRVAACVREGFQSFCRYLRIVNPWMKVGFEESESEAFFELNHQDPQLRFPRSYAEYCLAVIARRVMESSTEPWSPVRIELRGDFSGSPLDHERVFRAPVRFRAPADRIVLSSDVLPIPLRQSDPSLFALLSRLAEQELMKVVSPNELHGGVTSKSVRAYLGESLSHGDFSMAAVASRLGVSARTLQRKLRSEGTSFQEVLDGLRHELAEQFLKNREEITVADIVYLLGFSEPSAFYKAYRRWTGKSLRRLS